jgi:thiamine-monophosphate kinase
MRRDSENSGDLILSDLGEFRLLNEVVLPTINRGPIASPLGDDCTYIPVPESKGKLVFTTDAAPQPLIWQIGESSYKAWGWYAVLINLSDLAAAGARPIAFMSSVEAPSSMRVQDFRDFFAGMSTACKQFDTPNGGGNIRTANSFACHGTAIGLDDNAVPLTRRACKQGDPIVAIGTNGMFISAFIKAKTAGISSLSASERNLLFSPWPRLREMQLLHNAGLVTAASDNSDGVLGAIWNIAERSECVFELTPSEASIPSEVLAAAETIKADPWNLMFCWGDWQVIATVDGNRFGEFKQTADANRIPYLNLGVSQAGKPEIIWKQGSTTRTVKIVRNENFDRSSFNSSMEANLSHMLHTPFY